MSSGDGGYWLRDAYGSTVAAPHRLEADIEDVDVCIVGGGFTGLWTALQVKESDPSLRVVLIEARRCGDGASGRSGGFVMSWWSKFDLWADLLGGRRAVELCEASTEAIASIGSFCEENSIDADFRRSGWIWAATTDWQIDSWQSTVNALESWGVEPFIALTPEEVAERGGTPGNLAGVWEPASAAVHPGKLAVGLRRVALERGIEIFEGTAMTGLSRSQPVRVTTPKGTIEARKVILALNAWLSGIPELASSVAVVKSGMLVTEADTEALKRSGWLDGPTISDSRMMVNYYRPTVDGRVAFGVGGIGVGYAGRAGRLLESSLPEAELELITDRFHRIYPGLSELRLDGSWAGPIDRTKSGLPLIGRLPKNPDVIYAGGFSGNGVGPSHLVGRMLSEMVTGGAESFGDVTRKLAATGGFPPEPIRYLGGHLVKRAVARKEELADRGKQPGLLTRTLAGLAPSALVATDPVKTDEDRKD